MEDFPHLSAAPIVEAVIDIRVKPSVPLDESFVSEFLESRLDRYTFLDSQQEFSHQVMFGAHVPPNRQQYIRKGDNTVKPEAFVPHPCEDLSVTRHLSLTQAEIWSVGEDVAHQTGKNLHERADNQVINFLDHDLKVLPDPVFNNPNHANVTGWPTDKPRQKIIALEIASRSHFIHQMYASLSLT